MSGPDFATALALQVRAVVNLREENPYQFWVRHHKRESAGLLACSVLVMSRLGTRADGMLQHQGFHAAYNRDVLGISKVGPSRGFDKLDQLWEQLARYLAKDEGGELGRIAFFTVLEYTHLNYPGSQCLVRMSDRGRLHALFARYCDPEVQLDRSHLTGIFENDPPGFSVMFRRAYNRAAASSDLAREFWEIVDGEYAVWQAAPQQVERVKRTRADRKIAERGDRQIASVSTNVGNSPRDGQYSPDSRTTPPAEQSVGIGPVRPRVRPAPTHPAPLFSPTTRLVLVDPYRRPAELFVEVRVPAGGNVAIESAGPSDEGWVRLDGAIDAEMFDDGFARIFDGFRLSRDGASVLAFALGRRSWIETDVLKVDEPLRLVCGEEGAAQLGGLQAQAASFEQIAMEAEGLTCLSLTLRADVQRDKLPAVLSEVLSGSQSVVSLSSGLRLRSGEYLRHGPPLITFVHQTCERADVFIDEVLVGSAERDVPFRIPTDGLNPGRRTIRILDRTRTFVVCDRDDEETEAAEAPDSELGTLAAGHPPRLETSPIAEGYRTADLGRMNAVVVVGSEILLPYMRTGE